MSQKQLGALALLGLTWGLSTSGLAWGQVLIRKANYQLQGRIFEGLYARESTWGEKKRPAVLVFPDWMGVGDTVEERLKMFVKLGYVAFAADLYGQGIRPLDESEAAVLSGDLKANRPLLRDRAAAALAELKSFRLVDGGRISAIGYCFGGLTALELARSGADLVGVVSFHGNLNTQNLDEALRIKGKVLVFHGADDPYVPQPELLVFQEEMRKAEKDWQIVIYGGAVHSFTKKESGMDPARGVAYNPAADRRSWEAMKLFLSEVFEVPETLRPKKSVPQNVPSRKKPRTTLQRKASSGGPGSPVGTQELKNVEDGQNAHGGAVGADDREMP